jgi:hypothetical protein
MYLSVQSRMPASIEEFNKAKCMYVPVCTNMPFLYRYVQSTHQYVLVRTKYPVPVQPVTIPDVSYDIVGPDIVVSYDIVLKTTIS